MDQPGQNSQSLVHKAVVLLSGGLDSAVVLAYSQKQGYACYALTVDYGQRHRIEIERAKKLAVVLGAKEHKLMQIDLRALGGSVLTTDEPVPLARMNRDPHLAPATYVPARNTILLSLGLAWAEVLRAEALLIGANVVDYSGYPDCRPEYLKAFQHLASLATRAGQEEHWQLKIQAPLLHLSKSQIVTMGSKLGLDFALTSSCYNPGPAGQPCGQCEACFLRRQGFAQAGQIDPL